MIYLVYILFVFIFLCFYRLVKGPSFFDRILVLNVISLLVIMIFCVLSIIYKNAYYIDIAIVYSVLSFTGTIGFAKFFGKNI